MKVYMLDRCWVDRDSVLLDPERTVVQDAMAAFWEDEIAKFVQDYFYGKTTIFGITREVAKLFLMREFIKLKYISGFGSSVAFAGAKVNFIKFMTVTAGGLGWVAVGVVAAVVVLGVVYAIMDWLEADRGRLDFPVGSCILRYENRLWWGGVAAHPSELEWDFYCCKEIGEMWFYERFISGLEYMGLDEWDFLMCWELKEKRLVGWYVYRFSQLRLRFLGLAHNRGWGRYRLKLAEGSQQPYEYPVGWGIKEYDICKYVGNYSEYFA